MADLKAFLMEQGLTAEEIAGMSEKQQKVFATALGKYEEGSSALRTSSAELEAARAERAEANTFYEEKVVPALANVDKRVAVAESEKARYAAYLNSLKDQGYDVPDNLLTAPTKPGSEAVRDPETGKYVTPEQMGNEFKAVAPTMVSLISLSNEYQDLFGSPYVSADADWEEAQKARKPLREFVREKYKFADKKAERDKANEEKRIAAMVDERAKAKEAELTAKYGSNPDLRSPVASKFDRIEKMAEHKDSWKTRAGRETARKDRLERFANVTLQ